MAECLTAGRLGVTDYYDEAKELEVDLKTFASHELEESLDRRCGSREKVLLTKFTPETKLLDAMIAIILSCTLFYQPLSAENA